MRPSDEVESSILGKGQKESFCSLLVIFFFKMDGEVGDVASRSNNFCVKLALSNYDVFLSKGEEGSVVNQHTID